ncbi:MULTISPECIES: phage NrS-1 polymerase family protein [unclassified Mesorhizobium]|uniref:phage NrS-1 polymerase family protein n=1 Tax=unclassified Mesorhizobium TaxID=325217 RepID=UPI0030155103
MTMHFPNPPVLSGMPGVDPAAISDDIESFLREYIAPSDAIHLVSIDPTLPDSRKDKIRGKWFGDNWEGAAQWACEQNSKPRNLYVTFNIRAPGDKKPGKADIIGIRGFHADIDPPKGQPLDAWNKQAALIELQMIGMPSFVIDTGRGLQPIWLASEGITDFEAVESVNKAIAARFKGDNVSNVDRLCRLPGTVNWGSPDKNAAGYQPRVASLAMPFAGRTVTLAEMTAQFGVQASTVPAVITTGPVATWCGPQDDDELIRVMLNEKPGSTQKAFGDAATTRDLWDGNAAMLAKSFPADGDEHFNHSAADAALCQKLGFYTGNDAVRMERLFNRSALGQRSKWKERSDYRALTINNAVRFIQSKGGAVYRNEKYAPQVALDGEILPPVPASDGFMNLSEQPTHFSGCVYVRSEHAVLIPTGELLTPERFNAAYGGYSFAMQADGASPSKKAFECFTENRAIRFPQVATLDFDPERPFGDIRNDSVNIWMPVELGSSEGGAIDTVLEFYEHFIPDPVERDRHFKWMANKIVRPWERGCGVIFIAGDDHGTGRGLHFSIMESLIGTKYTRGIKYRSLIGEGGQAQFQDWKFRSLFVYVEEARNVAKSQSGKIAEYEELKENVDPSNFKAKEVARKTMTAVNARPFYSVILASNHSDAIWLHPDDRRFDVLTNGPRLSSELSEAVATWLRNPANVSAWAEHLRSIDLTGYNSYEIPPTTAAKLAMIDGARSELDHAVSAAIEAIPGELFMSHTVLAAVETTNICEGLELGSGWRNAARKMIKRYPVVIGGADRLRITLPPPNLVGLPGLIEPDKSSRLVTVFAKTKELSAKWKDRDTRELRKELGI